ncbi:hypothetical protein DY000_02008996 [Brassica cretica]|uniref:Uncharacterized protein n=1 Tax=Brassica cretica TaxID=69181 RepID=A0ABQ7BVH8_BRACR|nr:hypothetical protein DY000_02008996 [Brassica cretica]
MLEQMFNEDPDNIPEDWQLDDEDDTEPDTSDPLETVPLRGFDHDFWEPLIGENLGGSDAAEVMAGLHVPKTAPETYQSTTGSVFDHTVRLSGEDDTDWKRDLDFLGVHQKERPPGQSNPPYTRAQKDQPHTPYSRGHSDTPYTRTPTGTPYTPHVGVHPRTPYTQTRRVGLPHVQLVGDCYRTQTWKDTYAGVIYPEAPFGEIPIPPVIASLNLQPPNTRRPSGRPKDQRIPSTGSQKKQNLTNAAAAVLRDTTGLDANCPSNLW